MKYILAPHIGLRSWHLVPWAYYIKGARNAKGLKQEELKPTKILQITTRRKQ